MVDNSRINLMHGNDSIIEDVNTLKGLNTTMKLENGVGDNSNKNGQINFKDISKIYITTYPYQSVFENSMGASKKMGLQIKDNK